MCNRCGDYCIVTTHIRCETVVLNIALLRLIQNMKPSCILLYLHHCTECYSVTPHTRCETVVHNNLLSWFAQGVNALSRIVYCHDSHMSWNRGAEFCTVPTPRHDMKPLCRMLYCPDSHTMQIHHAFNYTVKTHAQYGTIVHKIVLSRLTRDVKALWRTLYCHKSHSMWNLLEQYHIVTTHTECTNRCAEYCTVMICSQCETIEQ